MILKMLEIAEYAAFTDDKKLIVSGIFTGITASRVENAPPEAPNIIGLPACYLVWIVEASLSEGLQHRVGLIIRGSDGEEVLRQPELGPMNFNLDKKGRPLRFNGRMVLKGIPLPGEGDYVFSLLVNGKELGETTLYVDVTRATGG